MTIRWSQLLYLIACVTLSLSCAADELPGDLKDVDIAAQPLAGALREFCSQAGFAILLPKSIEHSAVRAPAVRGRMSSRKALRRLLKGSSVTYGFTRPNNTLNFHAPESPTEPNPETPVQDESQDAAGPEVLVRGSRARNADRVRHADDPIPPTVFDRSFLERSGAATAGEFLKSALPAHIPAPIPVGAGIIAGGGTAINLRGLGTAHTLILIDGRRRAGPDLGGGQQQPDLDLIDLDSVERIEILPATMTGVFGRGATAGTINIVLRHEDQGTRASAQASRLSEISAGSRRVSAAHSDEARDGQISYSISASWSKEDEVSASERDTLRAGREQVHRNNPSAITTSDPPLGATANVRSVDGSPLAGCRESYLAVPFGWTPTDGDARLCEREGQYDFALAPSADVQGGALATARAAHEVRSLAAEARWEFTDWMSADLDFGYADSVRQGLFSLADQLPRTQRLEAGPLNPFHEAVLVTSAHRGGETPLKRMHRSAFASTAWNLSLPDDQVIRFEYNWSAADAQITRFAAGPGPDTYSRSVDALFAGSWGSAPVVSMRQSSPHHRSDVQETAVRYTTPLESPWGPLAHLALSAELRKERLAGASRLDEPFASESSLESAQSVGRPTQIVGSLQAALTMPFTNRVHPSGDAYFDGELDVRSDAWRVRLSSGEHKRYDTVSAIAGVRWRPSSSWLVRLGCGMGYLPPAVALLSEPVIMPGYSSEVEDPERPGETLNDVTLLAGGNVDELTPEEVRSCSAGVLFQSGTHLRISADFVQLNQKGMVLGSEDLFFRDPAAFIKEHPGRITRATSAEPGISAVGPIVQIDSRAQNIARQELQALDLAVDAQHDCAGGTLRFQGLATKQPLLRRQLAPNLLAVNEAGVGNQAPDDFRINATTTWSRKAITFGISTRFIPATKVRDEAVSAFQGGDRVSSQVYNDVFVSYLTTWPGRDVSMIVRIDGRNVLNADPPFDAAELQLASRYGVDEISAWMLTVRLALGRPSR